jgi:hypothetical protein
VLHRPVELARVIGQAVLASLYAGERVIGTWRTRKLVRRIPADLAGLPSLWLKEIVACAVVCLQASLAHHFDLDPVIPERVASDAAVAEGVLCV